MAYSARSGSTGDYISDAWGPTLNNASEENNEENSEENSEDDDKKNAKEVSSDEENNEEENGKDGGDDDDDDEETTKPFYKNIDDGYLSAISSTPRDTRLSTSPDDSNQGLDVFDSPSRQMERYGDRTDISSPATDSQCRESSGQLSPTVSLDSHLGRDGHISGVCLPSYSVSFDSYLTGVSDNTPSDSSTTGDSYSSSLLPLSSSTFNYDASANSDGLSSFDHPHGGPASTGYGEYSAYLYSNPSSPMCEGSTSFAYSDTSNSTYGGFSFDLPGSDSPYETPYSDPYDTEYSSSGANNSW